MPRQVQIAQESSEAVAVGINGYVAVVGAQCSGYFSSPVTVQVSGLPAGVTVSPHSLVITPTPAQPTPTAPPQPLTFSVSTSATPGSVTLTLTGTSSTMTASVSLPLSIMPANPLTPTPKCPSSTPPPAPNPNPTNEWTWESGSNTVDQSGVYGTEGAPSRANVPGARAGPASWTDSSGNFWLFGGYGVESQQADHNDLWEYGDGEWTWVGGSNQTEQPGVYGTLGRPAPSNVPGARYLAASWTDASGNFWLFGGLGLDSNRTRGDLNDLWKYNPATNVWTWMGGSNVSGQPGAYGTQGTPAPGNVPSGRVNAVGWADAQGNFWLFGGNGYDSRSNPLFIGDLNDLWKYNPATGMWTWMSGSNLADQPAMYGTLGVPAPGNVPPARWWAAGWTDRSGNLWLFGGFDMFGSPNGKFNDLWKYQP